MSCDECEKARKEADEARAERDIWKEHKERIALDYDVMLDERDAARASLAEAVRLLEVFDRSSNHDGNGEGRWFERRSAFLRAHPSTPAPAKETTP